MTSVVYNATSVAEPQYEGCYDALYARAPDHILWPDEPGRLVRRIGEFCRTGRVLDAGCGDGKNAIFLEEHGYLVRGFDRSSLAISGLFSRFMKRKLIPRGAYVRCDAADYRCQEVYDCLVSYGLFHCLPRGNRVSIHKRLQETVPRHGSMLFTCLTDRIGLTNHHTDGVVLASPHELASLFIGWRIEEIFDGDIVEDHRPLVGMHRHSAVWVVARKGYDS